MLVFEMAAGYPPFYSENKVEIFKAICEARYTFPDHFSKVATSACLARFTCISVLGLSVCPHVSPRVLTVIAWQQHGAAACLSAVDAVTP